jgi:hypothetical protein
MKFNVSIKRMLFYVSLVVLFFVAFGVSRQQPRPVEPADSEYGFAGEGLLFNWEFCQFVFDDDRELYLYVQSNTGSKEVWFASEFLFAYTEINYLRLIGIIACVVFVFLGFRMTRIQEAKD